MRIVELMLMSKTACIAIISMAMLSGCGTNEGAPFTQEKCDQLLRDANEWARLANEADLSGDTENYETFRDSFYIWSAEYDENCS